MGLADWMKSSDLPFFGESKTKQWYDPRDWGQTAAEVSAEYDINQKHKQAHGRPTDLFRDQVRAQRESRTEPNPEIHGAGIRYYPQELYTPSQPNGIHFYINARRSSAAAQAALTGGDQTALDRANAAYQEDYTKENRAKAEMYENTLSNTGALTAAIGTATAIKSGALLDKDASPFGQMATTVAGGLTGWAAGKMTAENNTTLRLLDSVQLYVPQSVVTAYQANWDQAELGMAGMLTTGRAGAGDFLSGDMAEMGVRGVVGSMANIPKAAGMNADFGAAFEATSKKVANPFKEQLFKSIGFRKFSFSYTFAPRNSSEYNNVASIVKLFKYHMHPEQSETDMFLIYPSEFSIKFEYFNGTDVHENMHMPHISSCILENVKVTYGPDGAFQTVQNSDGAPSEITMELSFAETEALTANRISQGL